MDVRSALMQVAGYSHQLGRDQPAQRHLQSTRRDPPPEFPIGLRVLVSGSGQSLPLIPWIALLDDDVTTTAQDGLYLVYLYTGSLDAVYLSMNQGATQHLRRAEARGLKGRAAETVAIDEIRNETVALRAGLDPSILADTFAEIDLQVPRFLPMAYEAGSIAALRYDLASLPAKDVLGRDLSRFATIYQQCIGIKDVLAANQHINTSARSETRRRLGPRSTPVFKPKDESDYLANVGAGTQRRGRKHETLVRLFGEAIQAAGHLAATNVHPRDLIVIREGEEWLVEAKTVGANAEPAVRDAIGQLLAYRHFYYRTKHKSDPRLLALFNASIGRAFEDLLASLGIDFVYRDADVWRGSHSGLKLLEHSEKN